MATRHRERAFEYDVCLSFAGEDRVYVRRTAEALRSQGIRVFYDEYSEVELWGKDLYTHLDQIYRESAHYCVVFISKHYAKKLWTNHERQSAQARAFKENKEYVLPVRFDSTTLPGLRDTVGFVDGSKKTPIDLAGMISRKLGDRQRSNFLPPVLDRLYKHLRVRGKKARESVDTHALAFMRTLERMTEQERLIVFTALHQGCPSELPENIHINIDLLRRLTGISPAMIKRRLGNLTSLGFSARIRDDDENEESLGRAEMLVLEWANMDVDAVDDEQDEYLSMAVAEGMVSLVTDGRCLECSRTALQRLDFGQLSAVTAEDEEHEVPNSE